MPQSAFQLLSKPIQQALWDMQWRELRPIQVASIQTILTSDRDLLISARTASGKTEAAFLPILSKLFEDPGQSIGAMYIGPLKALINDQFRRLEILCERAGIPVHRWHGDIDRGKKDKLLKDPQGVLLITPESLESFFVNRSSQLRHVFSDLRFTVIDEIHTMVGRERGLQLRSLLFRLRRYMRTDTRLAGLSATIGNSIELYQRWMCPRNSQSVAHIEDLGETKRVQFAIQTYIDSHDTVSNTSDSSLPDANEDSSSNVPSDLISDILRVFCGKKNLIFCNNRGTVELLADSLNDACRTTGRPEEFLVHHGSLSKEIRLFTEEQMRDSRPSTAICSSTLELGLDIGNVSTVGQIGPCWSVNSQVQRLGRSGRRDDEPHSMRIMLIVPPLSNNSNHTDRLYLELIQAIALTELMRQKWVEPPGSCEFDFSTLIQQILSSLAETGGITASQLFRRLQVDGAFPWVHRVAFQDVLRGLGKHELIQQMNDGLLLLAPKGEVLVHDLEFYSAFSTPQEFTVHHESRAIGKLSAILLPSLNDHIILAGRRWQIIAIDINKADVLVIPARGRKAPKFLGGPGEVHSRIRQKMCQILLNPETYSYLSQQASMLLQCAKDSYASFKVPLNGVIELGPTTYLWFLWRGTRILRTVVFLAQRTGFQVVVHKEVALEFEADSPIRFFASLLQECHFLKNNDASELEMDIVPSRKFDEYLPESLLKFSSLRECFDIAGTLELLTAISSGYSATELETLAIKPVKGVINPKTQTLSSEVKKEFTKASVNGATDFQFPEFIAFDLETTGLDKHNDEIVEIAAVRFQLCSEIRDSFHSLICPSIKIPDRATVIHGITNEMVARQPKIHDCLPDFLAFCSRSPSLLVAHNASFDVGFLKSAISQFCLSHTPLIIIDSLPLSRKAFPASPDFRLATIARYLGKTPAGAHRALVDVELLCFVFESAVKELGIRSVQSLLAIAKSYQLGVV